MASPNLRLTGVHRDLWREALAPGPREWLAWVVGLGLAGGVCSVGQALSLSRLVDQALFPAHLDTKTTTLIWLLGLAALRAALSGGSGAAAHRLAAAVKANLRHRLVASALGGGPAGLGDARTGELVGLLSDGVDSLEGYYAQYLPQLVFALTLPLLVVGVILRFDWLSGLILLLTGPLIPLFMVLIGQASAVLSRRQWQSLSRMSAFFFDVLQGLPTLKMLGQDARQMVQIQRTSQRYREAALAVLRVTFLSALTLELLSTLSVAVVAVQIGLRLLYGQMAFLPAFLILVLAPEYYLPLRLLALRYHAGASGAAAAEPIFARLSVHPARNLTERRPAPPAADRPPPEICLENLQFAYPGRPPVLNGVNCCLPAGQVTVLSGPSGAGKSTLAAVLLGAARASSESSGTLRVNGEVVSRVPGAASWVPQHPHLFQGSVAENIRLGCPSASDEEVRRAARKANAHEFIRALPEGYDTPLGERGLRLSGGQAQRIALARAFASQAPFAVFDEPAAHLDAASARVVWASIAALAGTHTVLVITHRTPLLVGSDSQSLQCLALRNGRIAPLAQPEDFAPDGRSGYGPRQPTSPDAGDVLAGGLADATGEIASLPPARLHPTAFLLSLLAPAAGGVALAALAGFAAIASGAGLMAAAAFILSRAAWPASIADLQVAVVGVRFFGLGRAVFRYLERLTAHGVTLDILANLRVRIYQAIAPLSPARLIGPQHSGSLLGPQHSGSLLGALTSDITALESFYVRAAAPPLAALLAAGALGLFLGAFTPALAVGVLGLLALNGGLLPLFVWVGARQAGPRLVAARSDFKVQLVDSLQGFPDLWVLGRAGDFQRRALSTAAELDRLNLQAGLQNSLFDAANMLCAHAAAWLALVITLPLAAAGEISPLAVGALVLVAQASFEAVQPLALAGRQLAADQAAASRLVAISQQTPAVDETAGVGLASTERPAHLVIENLSFRYPGPASVPPVLDGLSLDLQAGRVCVLLGPSGAGKSTVVNLMLRFWDNEGGTMRVAGQDLRSLRPDAARRCFGVVPQRIHLFSASLRENLLLARPEAVEEDLHRALALAGLADLCAALPEALDTWLGETGFRLSGGERQRLGIARAVLQDAPFTIFDEPAAHLDRQAAQAVLGRVVAHLRPRGGILVLAHDLDDDLASSLGPQDEILELKNGRVGWRGSLAAFHHRRAETGSPA